MPKNQSFSKTLLHWHQHLNPRSMPWKGIRDPYRIWLSEIILQQTRVDQGEKYYLNILKHYPNIQALAKADEAAVFRLWQGLGYYSRCRNLLATAKMVVQEFNGRFPDNYQDILKLKGIGPYTAAAISSFAYNLPYAVVDGNVIRVLSRYFGHFQEADTTIGKRFFADLAQQCLDPQQAGLYNQAIMDLGATVCKPALPNCPECPFRTSCYAYKHQKIKELPVPKKRVAVVERDLHFVVLESKSHILIQHRSGQDIWQNLYAFPQRDDDLLLATKLNPSKKQSPDLILEQTLTHRKIKGHFYRMSVKQKPQALIDSDNLWVPISELSHFAFPRLIISFFQKINYL